MGYIAPVPRYQIDPYSNRLKRSSNIHPSTVSLTKIKKVHNHHFSQILKEVRTDNPSPYNRRKSKNDEHEQSIKKLVAELTGLGTHIDETL